MTEWIDFLVYASLIVTYVVRLSNLDARGSRCRSWRTATRSG